MRILFLFILFSSIHLFCSAQSNKGWIKLLNGKNLNGWHTYGKQVAGNSWMVEKDGSLHLNTSSNNRVAGDLVTTDEYKNFDLKVEWKISKNGNSGILFLVHEDTAKYDYTFRTGPEMQVLDNDGHEDGKIYKHRAGDLYDLIACSKETVKPVGEWNKAEIICNNGNLQLFLNGTKVVETTLWNDEWNKMVSKSKFKTMPGFGRYHEGKIALQDHGNDVWFRNIEIKKL